MIHNLDSRPPCSRCSSPPSSTVAAGEARNDHIEEGDDTVDDRFADCADSIDDAHEAGTDGVEDALDTRYNSTHLEKKYQWSSQWFVLDLDESLNDVLGDGLNRVMYCYSLSW